MISLLKSSIDFPASLSPRYPLVTIIPSLITVVTAVCSLGIFSIFTRHGRQGPCIETGIGS